MRRVQTGVAVAIVFGMAGVVPVAQQTQQVWVRVADGTGASVTGLSAEQFTVLEDGVKCRTLKAEAMEWPMKLTVLVDNGGKSSDYLLSLRNGLRELFREVPGDVDTSLLTLAPQPRWVVRPTTDAETLVKGVGAITPVPGSGKFFDGLLEAVDRAVKDKGNFFPVFVMVVTTFGGREEPVGDSYQRLQKGLIARAGTVHFVLLETRSDNVGTVTGASQTTIGNQMASLTGGRYENIVTATRLDTLLPEIGRRIAQSAAKQKYQYRLTYEVPKGTKPNPTLAIDVALKGVTIDASVDGHLP
jgi:hypothetical protein